MPTLDIAPEKVAWLIIKAREFEAKVSSFDGGDQEGADEQFGSVLENRRDDATVSELTGFFQGLNVDEQANLVAIAWIGRGTYTVDDWDEAMATARSEKSSPTQRYLLGIPQLADYLEEGLDALGIDVAALESDAEQE